MPLKLNVGQKELLLNESRIQKMVSASSKEEAIRMGLLDRFKDLFRQQSKAESLKLLYSLIIADEDGAASEPERLKRFVALKALAIEERVSDFTIQRTDGYEERSTTPCSNYVLSIRGEVIAKGAPAEFHERQLVANLIASHVSLSTEAEIRSCQYLGGRTYGDVYKHETPAATWIYKLSKQGRTRGKPEIVCRAWNAVFREIYGGKFASLAVAEAVPLSDSSEGACALKAPFIEGDTPDADYDRSLLDNELKSIGWYMHDNNRNNVRIVDGHAIPIDFDLMERS